MGGGLTLQRMVEWWNVGMELELGLLRSITLSRTYLHCSQVSQDSSCDWLREKLARNIRDSLRSMVEEERDAVSRTFGRRY